MGICERSRDGDGLTCAGDGCQDGEEEERKVYSRHGDAVCAAYAVRRWLEDEHRAAKQGDGQGEAGELLPAASWLG